MFTGHSYKSSEQLFYKIQGWGNPNAHLQVDREAIYPYNAVALYNSSNKGNEPLTPHHG